MRLRFDPGDDDEYYDTREVLLDELEAGCVCPSGNELELVSDVGVFLDWRYRYSNGVLDNSPQ